MGKKIEFVKVSDLGKERPKRVWAFYADYRLCDGGMSSEIKYGHPKTWLGKETERYMWRIRNIEYPYHYNKLGMNIDESFLSVTLIWVTAHQEFVGKLFSSEKEARKWVKERREKSSRAWRAFLDDQPKE